VTKDVDMTEGDIPHTCTLGIACRPGQSAGRSTAVELLERASLLAELDEFYGAAVGGVGAIVFVSDAAEIHRSPSGSGSLGELGVAKDGVPAAQTWGGPPDFRNACGQQSRCRG
jgi:hypothetical protein